MAKIFQTISLEDRLKASAYNDVANVQKTVNQGGIELKAIPDAPSLNAIQLKASTASKPIASLPKIEPLSTKPLSKLATPFVNTKFRSAISLSDRLNQPKLGSTAHLPQVFLSDVYTDYIKITPFGIFEHTSYVDLSTPGVTPNQGGLNPTPIKFVSELAQGLIGSNNNYVSLIVVTTPQQDILTSQGTYLSNNIYRSFTITENSIAPESIVQYGSYKLDKPVAIESIVLSQGSYIENGKLISVTNITVSKPTPEQGGVNPTQPNPTPNQGGLNPVNITFEPNRTSPVLNTLGYAADRALSFFAPIVKHGSAEIETTKWATDVQPDQGRSIPKELPFSGYGTEKAARVSPLLQNAVDDPSGILRLYTPWNYDFAKPSYVNNNQKAANYAGVEYVKIGGQLVINPNSIFAQALGAAGTLDAQRSIIRNYVDFPRNNEGSLSEYKVLSYDQIASRANQTTSRRPDFRKTLGISAKQNTEWRQIAGKDVTQPGNDFIGLTIKSLIGAGTVSFSTYLTAFSDGFTANWNDVTYVGRMDTLKAYKGATRATNIAFKVPAFNKNELSGVYTRLNTLVNMSMWGKLNGSYVQSPACAITFGGWFKNTPIAINSVKFDVQLADYSWDLDSKLPMLVDVSMDFVPLTDNNGGVQKGGSTWISAVGKL